MTNINIYDMKHRPYAHTELKNKIEDKQQITEGQGRKMSMAEHSGTQFQIVQTSKEI